MATLIQYLLKILDITVSHQFPARGAKGTDVGDVFSKAL